MSASLAWFEAGIIAGSIIASLTWLGLIRRHRRQRNAHWVALSPYNYEGEAARLPRP